MSKLKLSIGLYVVTALLWIGATAAKAELRAGSAKIDITPDVMANHIPLGGYEARQGRPSTGVHDPVYARALVLDDGPHKVAIVSLDLCFLPANIKTDVLSRVKAAGVEGLDSIQLFLAATHTHSGPDPLAMHSSNTFTGIKGWTVYDAKLRDFTAEKIAEAVVTAAKKRVPAQIGAGAQQVQGLNRNRRSGPTVDQTLTILRVATQDGKEIADIVDFAAHPTLYDDDMMQVSADFPGVLCGDIEGQMGADAVCLFLNGIQGDVSPAGVDALKGDEKVTTYGHNLSKAAMTVLRTVTVKPSVSLDAWTQTVNLPPQKASNGFLISTGTLGVSMDLAKTVVKTIMPPTTQICFARIGGMLLIGFPCEVCTEVGLEAKELARKAGVALPTVVALTNDWLGYAVTPKDYHSGKYEAMMSFYGDQFSPVLLDAVHSGLSHKSASASLPRVQPK